jgi:hypothetical protein
MRIGMSRAPDVLESRLFRRRREEEKVQAEAGRATRQSGLTANAQTLTKQGFPA